MRKAPISMLFVFAVAFTVRADVLLTRTITNNEPYPSASIPHAAIRLYLSGPGAHDLQVLDYPPLCGPPQTQVDVPPSPNGVYVYWPCDCVQPGQSVTVSVLVPSGVEWTDNHFWGVNDHPCAGVLTTPVHVVDLDGDGDGFPDTNETFDLQLGLTNKSPGGLTNVVARLSTTDSRIDCVPSSAVAIGSLPSGATVQLPTPFRLHVHPAADRGGTAPPVTCTAGRCSNGAGACSTSASCVKTAADEFAATVVVTLTGDGLGGGLALDPIVLDLDLDSRTPVVATTTFAEGFEGGLGNMVAQSLDDGIANNTLSDGRRCQYNDPDFVNSNSFGDSSCYLGLASGQGNANDWHTHDTADSDGGRAYEGIRSMHYGIHQGPVGFDTYGLSQMDTIRTKNPIRLAARVCTNDPSPNPRACTTAADCAAVGGGPCVGASPELSFKHQVSVLDWRTVHGASDRAIVAARIGASGSWKKLAPYENVYDVQGTQNFSNCIFDPIDDGNDEDSYFDPTDPNRRLGPSSTCYPEWAFSYLGDTDAPFDPQAIGWASDGPGLQGSLGTGTWVESKFDLSRYRGRSIQLRWLLTSIKVSDSATVQDLFHFNPNAGDDGWYVDDVRVTQTLGASSPTVTLDSVDNSGLPGNLDGDARGDDCDCAPGDSTAFALPEVSNVTLGPDKATIAWTSAVSAAGSGTVHDVLSGRLSELPVGSGGAEVCVAPGTADASASDLSMPDAGTGFWYLVRAHNACGAGTYGSTSDGSPRSSGACP